jgi:hypothetical protein
VLACRGGGTDLSASVARLFHTSAANSIPRRARSSDKTDFPCFYVTASEPTLYAGGAQTPTGPNDRQVVALNPPEGNVASINHTHLGGSIQPTMILNDLIRI